MSIALSWLLASTVSRGQTALAAPAFTRAAGAYTDVFWLGMSTATPGATIHFTTDGSAPTDASPVFTAPILIATDTTVNAIALAPNMPPSATTSATYVIQIQTRTVPAMLNVGPPMYQNSPTGFLDACLHLDQWPTVLASATSVQTTVGLTAASDADLTACFASLAAHGVQLGIGANIINPFTTGTAAFLATAPILDRFIRLGAPLSTIFIDEPLSNATLTTVTPAQVAPETGTWMALVRARYGPIKLVMQEAYPSNSAATLITYVQAVNAAAAAHGVAGLDGFELDHDWNGTRWSVADIQAIHEAVRAARMRFSIIIWPSGPTSANDCDFGTRTYDQYRYVYTPGYLAYGEDFTPDMWSVESWSQIPSVTLPERGSGCSFMQAVRAIVALGI